MDFEIYVYQLTYFRACYIALKIGSILELNRNGKSRLISIEIKQ